ncbi:glucose dehydrogenase [FAD, quinone]-like isoform X2 [Rhipicephalus microplus]|uniref:glucose dehydrogenase [FAD, quinone]-like isoform X2 n=1 Tax=Rhipicephalus microplus TaxID=6941 RepID=UPI003F6AEC0F
MVQPAYMVFLAPKWPLLLIAGVLSLLHLERCPRISEYNTQKLHREYDYIIVGGGSAGCVLASRLSADPRRTVLLIEAGGVENAATDIPLLAITHFHGPFDWDYRTVPQKHACLGMDENRCNWARGKVLGGSSVINFQMHVRGNRRDFDYWQQEYGAFNWSYANVLPYFKKYENYMGPHPDRRFRGTKGKVPVTLSVTQTKLVSIFLKAGQWLGYPVTDYNGPEQIGFARTQSTIFQGRRYSAAKSYLRPIVKKRANLHLSLRSHAVKILFENQRAVGVQFKKQGTLIHRKVRARREIILSGGTIGSTQLLLLSGVGPARDLEELGIYNAFYKPYRGRNAFQLAPLLNRLKSRGVIKLRSKSYRDAPILNPRYYSHPADIEIAADAMLQCIRILSTKPFAEIGTKLWGIPFPPCQHYTTWSRDYLKCMARHLSHTGWHQCCTNPMGSDHRAVVDPRLRVRGGVKGLRVVDASVMPYIVSANLNAAVYMIAEKAADMIIEDNR